MADFNDEVTAIRLCFMGCRLPKRHALDLSAVGSWHESRPRRCRGDHLGARMAVGLLQASTTAIELSLPHLAG